MALDAGAAVALGANVVSVVGALIVASGLPHAESIAIAVADKQKGVYGASGSRKVAISHAETHHLPPVHVKSC